MAASYDNPIREFFIQPSSAFGATTESTQYKGPKGKVGLVRDIDLYLTATNVGTTTVPEIVVGTAQAVAAGTTLREYAMFRLGTTAIAGYAATAPFRASNLSSSNWGVSDLQDFLNHVAMARTRIPADATFFITRVAGSGGAPAGTGSSRVIIDFF